MKAAGRCGEPAPADASSPTSTSSSSGPASAGRSRRCGRREGLPGARARGRPALRGRGLRAHLVGPAPLPLGAAARLLRRPARPPAARRRHPRRCRGRWRVAQLRQHALPAADGRSTATRSGATSPTGAPSWRRTTRPRAGCSASSTNPCDGPVERAMRGRRRDLGVRETFRRTPVGVFFGDARRDGRRPLLRRRRAAAHRLHRVRQLHGRLPGRGQEHAGEELPRARRGARRRDRPMRTVTRLGVVPRVRTPATGRRAVHRVLHERTGPLGRPRPAGRHGAARRRRRRHLGHPDAAPRDARRGRAAAALGPRSGT